jgi:iron complex outermembrane receptor protein
MKIKKSYLMMAPAVLIGSQLALAQGAVLEEVVVTATKRAVNQMDTPLSLEVFTGANLERGGLTDLADISMLTPNVNISEGYTAGSVNIRGMGSGTDRGFEQSVALFVDDVYNPRSRQYRAAFFDMDRVEVMRGPQAVLFGLNATAGTISVISAKTQPGDEFSLKLIGEYETEYSGYKTSAVIGGSPTDNIGLRLAVEYGDSGDGYYENQATGKDETWNESLIVRGVGVFDLTENLRITAKAETVSNDQLGDNHEGYGVVQGAIGGDSKLDWKRVSNVVSLKGMTDKHGMYVDTETFMLNAEYTMGDHVFNAIASYSDAETQMATTAAVPLEGGAQNYFEDFEQVSGELRVSSPTEGSFSYIAGLYVSSSDNQQQYETNFGPFLVGSPGISLIRGQGNQIDTDVLSAYFSGTYNLTDNFRVIGGVRYSDEEKSSDTTAENMRNGRECGLYSSDGLGGFTFLQAAACINTEWAKETRSSDNWMPELILQYDLSQSTVGYAKVNRSVKSGGIATSADAPADKRIYDDEQATSFEVGLKSRFWDGRAEANVAVFYTEFEDLQVNTFVRVDETTFLSGIDNAAEVTTQGVELELNASVTDWLVLGTSLGYLDAQYDDYDGANCYSGETPNSETVLGKCDKSGSDTPLAPEFSGSVSANINVPVFADLFLTAGVVMGFSSSYFTEGTLDPTSKQDSYERWDANIGIAPGDDKWSLRVIGKNLSEEAILGSTQDIVGHVGFINAPRTVALQGIYSF